ncbi:hypothetical protein NicSoilC12_35080 [Arthrobacter sp. NicSoilC12]|nr:hypothetical protein NicSoilC12_35080 [Arthrobacter sp. NicSoilC12]
MEVGMKYLLEGGFPVCQDKVHSLAAKAASPKRFGESVPYAEHMRPPLPGPVPQDRRRGLWE